MVMKISYIEDTSENMTRITSLMSNNRATTAHY